MSDISTLKSLLSSIATVAGVLLTFAALILYGVSKVSEGQGGGVGEGKMIGCAIGAVACFGASVFISKADLDVSI
jgi:hypothetical protein